MSTKFKVLAVNRAFKFLLKVVFIAKQIFASVQEKTKVKEGKNYVFQEF